MTLDRERVLLALGRVQDPDLHRDLVTLGMIEDLAVDDGKVAFTLVLTTAACPLKDQIEGDCRTAVLAVPGVTRGRDPHHLAGAQAQGPDRRPQGAARASPT